MACLLPSARGQRKRIPRHDYHAGRIYQAAVSSRTASALCLKRSGHGQRCTSLAQPRPPLVPAQMPRCLRLLQPLPGESSPRHPPRPSVVDDSSCFGGLAYASRHRGRLLALSMEAVRQDATHSEKAIALPWQCVCANVCRSGSYLWRTRRRRMTPSATSSRAESSRASNAAKGRIRAVRSANRGDEGGGPSRPFSCPPYASRGASLPAAVGR